MRNGAHGSHLDKSESVLHQVDYQVQFNQKNVTAYLEEIGLKILEYCTDLYVHEKSNCMQFFFQTKLIKA